MATEQTIDNETYRTGGLNAKQQFHVARRLAPIVAALQSGTNMFQALATELAKLPEADVDYIMRTTMSVVMRKQGDQWVRVWNTQADMPQFSDITAGTLLTLLVVTLEDNLGGFTTGLDGSGQLASMFVPNAPLN
jgi:hypothetical protein